MIDRNGFISDAEGCTKLILEILGRRKHKIWRRVLPTEADEAAYVGWLARWAAHWGSLALHYTRKVA